MKRLLITVAGTLLAFQVGAQGVSGDVVSTMQRLANHDHVQQQEALGALHLKGIGGAKKNYIEARYWLERAAKNESPYAQYALSTIYLKGLGVPQDIKKWDYWLKKAALNGEKSAQLLMGKRYESGDSVGSGVQPDLVYAQFWFNKACDGGSPEACALSERIVMDPKSNLPRYTKEHLARVKDLARKGDAKASAVLGWNYLDGFGVRASSWKAKLWFKRSCDDGKYSSCIQYKQLSAW